MELIKGETVDQVLLLTLNRPERLNALNRGMLSALDEWIHYASTHPDVKVVVITGAGEKAFSAGADIEGLQNLNEDNAYELMRFGQKVFDRLEQLSKPVLAAVNGYALGGGCELALACDIRFICENASFAQPEILLANIPGWGGTQRLPRLVGPSWAKEMIFSGDRIDAETAVKIGLANRVYTKEHLIEEVLRFANKLADRSAFAIGLAKETIHYGLASGMDLGLDREAKGVARCCSTPEQHQAVSTFLARRGKKA